MTRPPRDPDAFPLARIWAGLTDWEQKAITDHFGLHPTTGSAKRELDKMSEEWTQQLQKDAGLAEKPRKNNVIPFTRGKRKK